MQQVEGFLQVTSPSSPPDLPCVCAHGARLCSQAWLPDQAQGRGCSKRFTFWMGKHTTQAGPVPAARGGGRAGAAQGERDYRALKGDTGPLVYPAGFLYVFSALHWLTGGGRVRPGQYLFAGIYLATLAVVLWLYIRAKARARPRTRARPPASMLLRARPLAERAHARTAAEAAAAMPQRKQPSRPACKGAGL
jgi:hypothetical protein